MAKSIPVKANDSIIYHIELVHDFSMFPAFLQELGYGRSQKICIVTDSNVAPLYARDVQDLLEKEFDTVILHTFEAGEHNKNLETVNSLYQTLIEQHFDRQDLLGRFRRRALSAILPVLRRRPTCAALILSRCRPRCFPR